MPAPRVSRARSRRPPPPSLLRHVRRRWLSLLPTLPPRSRARRPSTDLRPRRSPASRRGRARGIVAAALFSFVISFENLEVSVLLVSPGNTTLPIAMLQYLEWNMDPTLAAASTIQILIIGSLLLISDRFVKLSQVV